MIGLRNIHKYPRAVREEFENVVFQITEFLDRIFDADGVPLPGGPLTQVEMITKCLHEDVAFGSTETTHTATLTSFAGFEDAAEDEVMLHFHGPEIVLDSNNRIWSVAMDPTTFPIITFRKASIQASGSSADLPVSTHYWSAWRRRSV